MTIAFIVFIILGFAFFYWDQKYNAKNRHGH